MALFVFKSKRVNMKSALVLVLVVLGIVSAHGGYPPNFNQYGAPPAGYPVPQQQQPQADYPYQQPVPFPGQQPAAYQLPPRPEVTMVELNGDNFQVYLGDTPVLEFHKKNRISREAKLLQKGHEFLVIKSKGNSWIIDFKDQQLRGLKTKIDDHNRNQLIVQDKKTEVPLYVVKKLGLR